MRALNRTGSKTATHVAFLRSVPLFEQLGDDDLTKIAEDLHTHTYHRNDILFYQGDLGQDLYIVRSGKIRIFRSSPSGNETSINLFCAGDIIGEFAVLDQQPRSATAKAMTTCVVLSLSGPAFLRHLRTIPDLSLALSQMLVTKLRWTAAYAETVAQYDAAGRLLHILLLFNEQFGEPIEPGKSYRLDLALTQDDLASLVGARREWINRLLQVWRRKGLLSYQGGKITILDLQQVEAERDRRLEGNLLDD